MYIITWEVCEDQGIDAIVGHAHLFDSALIVIALEDGKYIISGGQDGMTQYLKKNDLYLKNPKIEQTQGGPNDRQKSLIQLLMVSWHIMMEILIQCLMVKN